MKQPRFVLSFLLLVIILFSMLGCRGGIYLPATADVDLDSEIKLITTEGGAFTSITPTGLSLILEDKDFSLVNVHVPYVGEIENTDYFIPYNKIDEYLEKLPADKDARIVLYCFKDGASDQAARHLVDLGYTNVWKLAGGMEAWELAGNKLVVKDQ